jgi:hypothetical protein
MCMARKSIWCSIVCHFTNSFIRISWLHWHPSVISVHTIIDISACSYTHVSSYPLTCVPSHYHIYVLILLHARPHNSICVLILLYMCPHTTIDVSSYPHTYVSSIPLHVSSYYSMCAHTTALVTSCNNCNSATQQLHPKKDPNSQPCNPFFPSLPPPPRYPNVELSLGSLCIHRILNSWNWKGMHSVLYCTCGHSNSASFIVLAGIVTREISGEEK